MPSLPWNQSLNQDGSRESEKWLNSRFFLKIDLARAVDGLDVRHVRKRKNKDYSRALAESKWKSGAFNGDGEDHRGARLGRRWCGEE